MKFFLIGFGLSILGVLVSYIIWGMHKMYFLSGWIGIVLIALCVVFSGSLLTGDRSRANYATETREDRLRRDQFTTYCFLMALPNIVIAGILYYFSYKGLI